MFLLMAIATYYVYWTLTRWRLPGGSLGQDHHEPAAYRFSKEGEVYRQLVDSLQKNAHDNDWHPMQYISSTVSADALCDSAECLPPTGVPLMMKTDRPS